MYLPCSRCEHSTAHTLAYSEDSIIIVSDADGCETDEAAIYYLFRCDGCAQLSLHISSNFDSPEAEFGNQVYPPPGRLPDKIFVPSAVLDAWEQAENVRNRSSNAYAMMARRVLEAIAKQQGVEERNLSRALTLLAKRTQMSPLFVEALGILRNAGNSGAHYSELDFDQISTSMIHELLRIGIDYLYVTPARVRTCKEFLT